MVISLFEPSKKMQANLVAKIRFVSETILFFLLLFLVLSVTLLRCQLLLSVVAAIRYCLYTDLHLKHWNREMYSNQTHISRNQRVIYHNRIMIENDKQQQR